MRLTIPTVREMIMAGVMGYVTGGALLFALAYLWF